MTDDTLDRRLEQLRARIDQLPPEQHEQLHALLRETRRRHTELSKNLEKARTAVDDCRLAMKCALFTFETMPGRRGSGDRPDADSHE